MSVVAIPPASPVYDWEVQGFYPEPTTTTATVAEWEEGALGLRELIDLTSAPRDGFNAYRMAGGAGFSESIREDRGVYCASCASTSIGDYQSTLGAIAAQPITDVTGLAAGYRNESWRRVFRFTWRMSQADVAAPNLPLLTRRSGFMMIPFGAPQAVDTWNDWGFAIANNGGFGVVGSDDGTDGWSWGMYSTGASPGNIIEEVPLGLDATRWNQFEIQITTGAPGREALLELFLNGVPRLNRAWVGAAPLIPPLTATEYGWHPSFRLGDGNPPSGPTNIRFNRADWSCHQGRFINTGLEVFT